MKKILLIILVLISFSPVRIFGASLITTEGLLDDSYLEEDSLYYIESDVIWDKSGDYYADYYSPEISTEVRHDIFIRTEEELKAGISFLDLVDNYDIEEVYPFGIIHNSKNSFFLYGNINTGDLPYQTQDRSVFAYLAYFENKQKIWDVIVHSDRYGSFYDGCLTENGIAVIGSYDSLTEGKNIIIYEVNSSKEILFQKEMSGFGDDEGYRIFYSRNQFHILGTTTSDDRDFERCADRNRVAFVGSLNRDNNFKAFAVKEDSDFFEGIYKEGKFILIYEFINSVSKEKNLELVIISEDLRKIENRYSLGKLHFKVGFSLFKLEKCLLCIYQKNGSELVFLRFDLNLNLLDEEVFISEYIIHSHKAMFTNLPVFIISRIKDSNYSLIFLKYDSGEFKIIKEFELKESHKVIDASLSHQGIINFCLESRGKIYRYGFKHYRLEENKEINTDYQILKKDLKFNGQSLTKNYQSDNIPVSPYGNYYKIYSYKDEDLIIYLKDEYLYPAKVNIRNREVYDLGVSLIFNGDGYLNGNRIESGYKVEEEGHYLLEIRSGEDFEAFVFQVAILSEIDEDIHLSKNLEFGEIRKKQIQIKNNNLIDISLKEEKESINYFFPSLFGGLIIGIILGFLLPKINFRRGKNV